MNPIWLSKAKKEFFQGKKVLVRIDADVDLRSEAGRLVVDEDFRLRSVLPTIHFLEETGAKQIILIGHLGRPGGKVTPELSLQPVADWLTQKLGYGRLVSLADLIHQSTKQLDDRLLLLENIRFYPGEEENDEQFSRELASLADCYVNEAFAVAHRNHASIVGLPKLLPAFLGLGFEAEVKTLIWVKKKAPRPIIFLLGGSKPDKLDYFPFLTGWADYLLVGGKLPLLLKNQNQKNNLIIGQLSEDGRDLSLGTIKRFKNILAQGATIIWAGPMGVYEEKENQLGTFEIAQAIAKSKAFKIAGGGDTHRVLSWLDLWDRFDFVSVGGGAMLQFLRDETLPGLEAVNR